MLRRSSLLITCLQFCALAWAQDGVQEAIDATRELLPLSIEELNDLNVSTLARQQQLVKDSPTAAFVITAEDIRRSGATSLPELLRMVPGMNVARINAWNYAVSARGFNDFLANKLQVMIDGRSLYDPLTSGVYWEENNFALSDIERIEIMRGPSGTLWGANAVNGVINIVTRSAKDTQGSLLTVGGGTEDQGFGSIRYGQKLSESTFLRGTLNAVIRDESLDSSGVKGTGDHGDRVRVITVTAKWPISDWTVNSVRTMISCCKRMSFAIVLALLAWEKR